MKRRTRLLVTGATGLLGWTLIREGRAQHEVLGIARHIESALLPCRSRAVDLVDEGAVQRVVESFAPDLVIHSAALTSVDHCQRDPSLAVKVNVEGTRHLLKALRGQACRFVLISTDSVFDGAKGDYAETDPPCPVNVYGRTKLAAEEAVLADRPDALVVRTCFYGWNLLAKESLGEWILNRLRMGQTVPGYDGLRFSPLLAAQLARLLFTLAPSDAAGVLHVASTDGCSKYEFARELATVFGFSGDRIIPAVRDAACLAAPRPPNVTLAVGRANAILGQFLPSVAEGLQEFFTSEPTVKGVRLTVSPTTGARS